jgi:hypothetical protein
MEKSNREIAGIGRLSEIPDPLSREELERVKSNILKAIAGVAVAEAVVKTGRLNLKFRPLVNYLAAAVLGLSLLGGTAFAAGSSIPGDPLYPVKLATEKVELSLAFSRQSKISLQAKFAGERLNELQKLAAKISPLAALPPHSGSAGFASSSAPGIFTKRSATTTPPLGSAVPMPLGGPNPQRDELIKLAVQARANAAAQVNSALGALSQEQDQLLTKGDATAAAGIAKNISDLRTQAGALNIDLGNAAGSGTPPSGPSGQKNPGPKQPAQNQNKGRPQKGGNGPSGKNNSKANLNPPAPNEQPEFFGQTPSPAPNPAAPPQQ